VDVYQVQSLLSDWNKVRYHWYRAADWWGRNGQEVRLSVNLCASHGEGATLLGGTERRSSTIAGGDEEGSELVVGELGHFKKLGWLGW
jgi:hypothetical protein